MENNDIFMNVILNDKVKLEPTCLNGNIRQELVKRLKGKLEGVCSKHGYIKHDTIEIYKVKPGVLEIVSLNGCTNYDVYFHAQICNPLVGSTIKCRVTNINRFGILAEAGYLVKGKDFVSILEVIIAKNSVSIVSEVKLDAIKIGDEVNIEVVGKKYELNDRKISIVGRIVNSQSNKENKTGGGEKKKVEQQEDEELEEELLPNDEDEDEEGDDKSSSNNFGEDEEEVEREEEMSEEDEVSKVDELFSDEDNELFDDDDDSFDNDVDNDNDNDSKFGDD